jgi:G6PDH family F420-dependent oxidoreductase
MLIEAVALIRELWSGETVSWWGNHYVVEDAKLFTLPDKLPEIMMAASGETSTQAAGEIADGFIGLAPDKEIIQRFEAAGGKSKPRYGQLAVCWAETEAKAREIVYKIWPNSGLTGELSQELRTVAHFEQAVELVTEETATKDLVCGPDPEKHIKGIQAFIDAGYDHVYIHQIGHDQSGFFDFYADKILPELDLGS